jgi:hypothetical protein
MKKLIKDKVRTARIASEHLECIENMDMTFQSYLDLCLRRDFAEQLEFINLLSQISDDDRDNHRKRKI